MAEALKWLSVLSMQLLHRATPDASAGLVGSWVCSTAVSSVADGKSLRPQLQRVSAAV